MSVRRVTMVGAFVLYLVLWALALNGASSFVAPLLIPLVLAVLVALGVALNRFLGVTPHRTHFGGSDDETEK